jgi:transcriptional regulator with XRE-family HTH domain
MTDDKPALERTAAKLKKARLAKRLTQAEVAKRADISATHYAQVERAEKNPSTTVFMRIIDALGVSSKDILGR